ncbi:mitochondrial inner membrane protein OXA1-like [Canna indica]|uniref:Mitochondrial inner membrane protein OXA1-like n=1 Tax=Canna indica TaxID=4628 RepID=A0AAQ3QI14_9LILI|nr:mitochondrial inner membrane protein OXA1-like [Canna indica]
MASCCRRSLNSNFNHLTRRLRPFSHILRDDRQSTEPPNPLHMPPITTRLLHVSAFSPSVSGFVGWKSLGLSLPLALNSCLLRSYSSNARGSNEFDEFSNATQVLSDGCVETGAATTAAAVPVPFPGEVAAAAAGSSLSLAALQHLVDAVHSFSGLNWWASIALTTLLIRGASIPLMLDRMKKEMKHKILTPEVERLVDQIDRMCFQSTFDGLEQVNALLRKHGCSQFDQAIGFLTNGLIVTSFSLAIKNMVENVPSFKEGGAFWFTDLTTPDPLFLPALTVLTFWATVEAILIYWITSNIFSIMSGLVLRQPSVRKLLNFPDVLNQPPRLRQISLPLILPSQWYQLPHYCIRSLSKMNAVERRESSSSVISN